MVRYTRVWILNIRQNHWAKCVQGPQDPSIHGAENIGKPWFGRRAKSHPDFRKGDVAIVRLASRGGNQPSGAYGIWRLMSSTQIDSQRHVPWTDGPYKRVLYCRAIQRELPQVLTEHFEHNSEIPFDQRTIQSDAKSLETGDAYGYVSWLLRQDGLNEEAVETLQETLWELNGASPTAAGVERSSSSEGSSSNNRGTRRGRYQSAVDRRYRDETLVQELKQRYGNECQICGTRRQKGTTAGYSEVHHIKPLGLPHDGPDKRGNLLVLCPNHHSDFDYGAIEVDPSTLKLNHLYEASISGTELDVRHSVDSAMFRYHNRIISQIP